MHIIGSDTSGLNIDFSQVRTPAYVVDEGLLRKNLTILDQVQQTTGCKIVLALKGFSMHAVFPIVGEYLAGITASALFEARLGREKMGKEVHIYSPAYIEEDFEQILDTVDHIVFNSFNEWQLYRDRVLNHSRPIEAGIRINPEYSEIKTALYNPSAPYSRLGVTAANFRPDLLEGISGLHFHTLCEQNADALGRTVPYIDEKFGSFLHKMKWLNLGGGHHITRPDYDLEQLVNIIRHFQKTYELEIYLEPGEAIALNTGFLVAQVLDIVDNGMEIAILDTSAANHMPDVIEMPYRPVILGAGEPGEKAFTYRLGGPTCLAGDIVGDYSFAEPLRRGTRLVFTDMAHYTMVKNNMFNGVNLPDIVLNTQSGNQLIRRFDYADYRDRLS